MPSILVCWIVYSVLIKFSEGEIDQFCRKHVDPPKDIEITKDGGEAVVAWNKGNDTKLCLLTYNLRVSIDDAVVVRVTTDALMHRFRYPIEGCTIAVINIKAISDSYVQSEEIRKEIWMECDTDINERDVKNPEAKNDEKVFGRYRFGKNRMDYEDVDRLANIKMMDIFGALSLNDRMFLRNDSRNDIRLTKTII